MGNTVKKREEIDTQYQWNLDDIYTNEDLWEQDFAAITEMIKQFEQRQGTLAESSNNLMDTITLMETNSRKMEKLILYAKMRRDENNADSRYQTLYDRAEGIMIKSGSATSYILPEITTIPEETITAFMAENNDLKLYKHFFDELMRQKEHILSAPEERLLAMSADLSAASSNIFNMFNNADIKFPIIKDENQNEVEITKGRYGSLMENSDRTVRQEAFEGLYSSYIKMKNTLANTLSSSVKSDIFYARARKYGSALEASLDQDNITPAVYDRLIDSLHQNMEPMYRYMKLRKKIMGLDELHMYDIYTPLVQEHNIAVEYEKACEMMLKGLAPLGDEYLQLLKRGIESRWIDVYENEGKTSGAYSWGSYDTHPYVLMNYDNKLNDVFTLVHEMGHSLHSYYSDEAQPYVYAQYPIFLAEVASTVNESLLIDYLLANTADKREKMYLINHYLEEFRGTVYRQTMFAEFEKIIHEKVEAGETLTPDALCEIYRELNRLYYGPEVVLDQEIDIEWARIPHFYSAFYVYKYATGFSAATAIKEMILSEGEPARQRYLEFLRSGASDYPVNLLKKAGVDLTTPEPVEKALKYFSSLVDELEALV